MTYRETAKELGVYYLFGKYGIQLLCRDPSGKVYRLFSIVRLDGWVFDKQEILQAMFDDPDFDVVIDQKGKL